MNKTTDDRTAAIRARLAAATPAPWYWQGGETCGTTYVDHELVTQSDIVLYAAPFDEGGADIDGSPSDLELVANAPADLAWCLDRIAELEAQAAELLPHAFDAASDDFSGASDTLWRRIAGGEFGPPTTHMVAALAWQDSQDAEAPEA